MLSRQICTPGNIATSRFSCQEKMEVRANAASRRLKARSSAPMPVGEDESVDPEKVDFSR
jgi:hypothetical protein